MTGKPILGRRLSNIAKKNPINDEQAKAIANREITLRKFNPDYDMMLKRISTAPQGLGYGQAPGIVT